MASVQEIRQAAVRLFAAQGFAATGIRELGREVGLNSATLYHYVGGKEELLTGIMRAGMEELLRAGREAVGHSADPAIQLARLVCAHVAMETTNPLTSRVNDREVHALAGDNHKLIMNMRDDYESLFERVLERGDRTGQFSVRDLPVTRFALLEMCNGVSDWYRPDGRLSIGALQDLFVEFACRLTGAPTVERAEFGPEIVVARLDSEPRGSDHRAGVSE
ncbi:TetR family transcriptional regulator [Nocardia beijingensis]|uniref:TetR/AcrR family transcriptional regulator n=1 Tax=Nocardia beijingensis TaxID=95162 RepID=UPI0018935A14|nr:TetR/AcrR family transcriptional regulator [Nocardia beijingensis]MBF6469995.1 TetR family transcriptional regulator [Nocardia beijingensis]